MKRPWMPLYVPDYLGDTGHLSTLEHGAYLLLIMHYWMNGGLPDRETHLARIVRLSVKEWQEVSPTLSDLFEPGWRHKRIDAELLESEQRYRRRADAGRKGGQAANARSKPSETDDNAEAMLEQCSTNAEAARGTRQPQPQPHGGLSSDNTTTVDVGADAGVRTRAELDRIEQACRVAADAVDNPSPALFDLRPILAFLDEGHDLERDILPILRTNRKHNLASWRYYRRPIADGIALAIADREAATGIEPSARGSPGQPRHRNGYLAALHRSHHARSQQPISETLPDAAEHGQGGRVVALEARSARTRDTD